MCFKLVTIILRGLVQYLSIYWYLLDLVDRRNNKRSLLLDLQMQVLWKFYVSATFPVECAVEILRVYSTFSVECVVEILFVSTFPV